MSNLGERKFGTFPGLSLVLDVAVDHLLLGRESELERQVLGEDGFQSSSRSISSSRALRAVAVFA